MLLPGIYVQKSRHLAWSEGGISGPLTSNGWDSCTGPGLGAVVPTSLSQLKLELDTADSKYLKITGVKSYCLGNTKLGGHTTKQLK